VSQETYPWTPIHGFQSYRHYEEFVRELESVVQQGSADEIPPDSEYHFGMIYGGRWFRDRRSGAGWRLIEPEAPFRGIWEPVHRE
jgi:hypothetical protein